MPRKGQFTWDSKASRYRDWQGHFVPPKRVRLALDKALDATARDIRVFTQQFRDREISLIEWRREMRAAIKDSQLYAGAAARGGFAQFDQVDFGRIGGLTGKQYKHLEDFLKQINDGSTPFDGRIVSRAALYVQSARATYERMRMIEQRDNNSMTEERSLLHPAEHCDECIAEAAKGWQPIGSLIPIGERTCLGNDRCTMEYRAK